MSGEERKPSFFDARSVTPDWLARTKETIGTRAPAAGEKLNRMIGDPAAAWNREAKRFAQANLPHARLRF